MQVVTLILKVCIGDIRAERGAATCQKLQTSYPGCVIFVPCDVTEDKQIEGKCYNVVILFIL